MDWDRLPTARRIVKQDRLLVRYLREEVHPFSATEARRLDGAGLGSGGKLRGADDLARLAPVEPADVDGLEAVLRPTAAGLSGSPDRFRWWWATITGRRATFVDEEIDPRFRTIHFDDHGPLLVASSAADLDRLADLGRRALGLAGVRRDDAVVTLLPARGDLAFWTVALGCRRSGVAALHLGEAAAGAEVAGYAPSVLVGTAASLRRVAAEEPEVAATVALVLAAERLDAAARSSLADAFPGAAVRALWSPPGVRAPWVECVHGRLHTWPDAEVLQTTNGEVVWTPLGWRGTVVLRLRTGIRARIVDQACRCGATSPRLELLDDQVADDVPDLAALELQRGERRNRRVDHGVMADAALADAFFADDPAAALATYTSTADPDTDAEADGAFAADDEPVDAVDEQAGQSAVDVDPADVAGAGGHAVAEAEPVADEGRGRPAEVDQADVAAERPAGPGRSGRSGGRRRGAGDVDPAEVSAPDRSGRSGGRAVAEDEPIDAVPELRGRPGPGRSGRSGRRDAADVDPAEVASGRQRRRAAAEDEPAAAPANDDEARLAAILDREERVSAWIAEVEANGAGSAHLVVRLAPVVGERAGLEADLPRLGAALGAGRIVVERPSVVRQRLEAAGGARFVDHP